MEEFLSHSVLFRTPIEFFEEVFRDKRVIKLLNKLDNDPTPWEAEELVSTELLRCFCVMIDHPEHRLPTTELHHSPNQLEEDYFILKPQVKVKRKTLILVRKMANLLRNDDQYYRLMNALRSLSEKINQENVKELGLRDAFPDHEQFSNLIKNFILWRRLLINPPLGLKLIKNQLFDLNSNVSFLIETIQAFMEESMPDYRHILTADRVTNVCATLYSLGFPFEVEREWIIETSNVPNMSYIGELHKELECLMVRTASGTKLITRSGKVVRRVVVNPEGEFKTEAAVREVIVKLPTLFTRLISGRLHHACLQHEGAIKPEFIQGRWRIIVFPEAIRKFIPNQEEAEHYTVPIEENHYVHEYRKLQAYGVRIIIQEDLEHIRDREGKSVTLPMIYIDDFGHATMINHHRILAAEYVKIPIEVMIVEDDNILNIL